MNSLFNSFLLLIVFSPFIFAENLTPFELDGKFGFENEDGEQFISPIYDEAESFSEGVAPVKKSGLWGYIDEKGNQVIPFLYDSAARFSEGRARVKSNSSYLCINIANKVLFVKNTSFSSFKNGLSIIVEKSPKGKTHSIYIGTDGQEVFRVTGTGFHFVEGYAVFYVLDKELNKEKYGFISMRGKVTITPSFINVLNFSEGLAAAQDTTGLWGFIDSAGDWFIRPEFNEVMGGFRDGYAKVHKGGRFLDGSERVEYEGGEWLTISKFYQASEKKSRGHAQEKSRGHAQEKSRGHRRKKVGDMRSKSMIDND